MVVGRAGRERIGANLANNRKKGPDSNPAQQDCSLSKFNLWLRLAKQVGHGCRARIASMIQAGQTKPAFQSAQ
jgi:hypothetical protein